MSDNAAPVTEMSEAQVVAGLEGLLDPQPRKRATPAPTPQTQEPADAGDEIGDAPTGAAPDDAGPDEPSPGDEEQQQEPDAAEEEAEDHPGIEAPDYWSKEDKAVFAQLPPEAQAIIARKDSEQKAVFTRKTQEIAEHRKALESSFETIQQERNIYAQNLQQLLFVAAPEAQMFANVDWQRLAAEKPAEYVRLTAERDALRGRVGAIQGELQRVNQQAEQAKAEQFATQRQAEHQRLVERLPDFGDEAKGPKLAGDIRQWLEQQGFSREEIGQVIDHRVILVAERAMRADRQMQIRQEAQQKRTVTAPSVQPPGAGRQRSDTQAGQRRQQKIAALRRSGSEKDAVSILMDML